MNSLLDKEVFKCPGKVLIAGGYAVLYESQPSISLGIDKGFYSFVQTLSENEGIIEFHSPQFDQQWKYKIVENAISQLNGLKNPYVQAIALVFSKYYKDETSNIRITFFSDPEFYTISKKGLDKLGSLSEIKKTGLGSSSALIVCCLGSLLRHIGIKDLDTLYEACFKANQIAQNKVGSGFDISTCILGCQIYSRPKEGQYIPERNQRFILSPKFKLLMIDLNQGQNTILSVGKVTQYLNNHIIVRDNFLKESNVCINNLILSLKQLEEGQSKQQSKILEINYRYRILLKQLGEASQCEIEPNIATFLIDKLLELDEIVYGICPGAGGYDAIAILIIQEQDLDLMKYQQILDDLIKQYEPLTERKLQVFQLDLDYEGLTQLSFDSYNYKFISQYF